MYEGELYIDDRDSMEEFFENTTLITEEEKEQARQVVEDADTVNWPVELVFEIEDETWEDYASEHPDEAKILEQHLEHDGDKEASVEA